MPLKRPAPRPRLRPSVIAVLLTIVTIVVLAITRVAMPVGLEAAAPLPAAFGDLTHQIAGYLYITHEGSDRVTLFAEAHARLVVDGRLAAETGPAGGEAAVALPLLSGPHRIHIQHAQAPSGKQPELRWRVSTEPWTPIPNIAMSPRRLVPLAWSMRPWLEPIGLTLAAAWLALAAWAMLTRASRWFDQYRPESSVDRRALMAVLALALAIDAYAVWWGLPGGWAQDEIGPDDVLAGMERGFAGGWHFRYPPLHFYLLGLVYLPFLGGAHHDLFNAHAEIPGALMSLSGRLLNVAMAVGSTALVYVCGRIAASTRTGVLAALLWSLVLPLAYYAKMVNLDVPYTFWFALSLVGYLRALTRGATRDFILFGAAAAAAICTKDQAYGLYAFPALYLAVVRRQAWRALAGASAAALVVFAAAHNLLFNWYGFTEHVRDITGGFSESFRMIDSTSASGQLWLFWRALQQIVWSISWPGALAAAAGCAMALRDSPQPRRLLAALLLAPASYYVTFIAVVGYHYDRFFLPVCLVLAIVAARAVDRLWPERHGRWKTAAVAAALVYMTVRTSSIDVLMAADGRYTVERWMRHHIPPGALVGAIEFPELLPRLRGYRYIFLFGRDDRLEDHHPDAFVISEHYPRRFVLGARELRWYDDLMAGRLGYREAFRHKSSVPLAIVTRERPFREFDGTFTTLFKVNPEIVVFVRE